MVFKVRKTDIIEIGVLFIVIYAFSLLLFSYYTAGDQYHYNKFYGFIQLNIANQAIHSLYEGMHNLIGAKEPVYFAVVYISVWLGLSKVVTMSFFNGLLGIFTYIFLQQKKVYKLYSILAIFSFYFLVLYTGAERLKFGFVFAMLGLVFYNTSRIKSSYICVLLSILSHFSMVLFYVALLIYRSDFKINLERMRVYSVVVFIFTLMFLMFKSILYSKLENYIDSVTLIDFIKSITIFLIAIFFYQGERRVNMFSLFLFFVLVTLLLGNRAFMFEVFFFVYFILPRKNSDTNKYNLIFLVLIGILLIKGVFFVHNIFYMEMGLVR